jgi:molybdenum ABC transporter molybdate-binding protein
MRPRRLRTQTQALVNPAPADLMPVGSTGWGVGLRVWIERAGRSILGPGRRALLEAIDGSHSISAAARQLGMSYRRAWELVQDMNAAAGEPLVTAATGGVHGGGAALTPLGRWAIGILRDVQTQLQQTAAGLLPRLRVQAQDTAIHVVAAVSLEEVVGQILTEFAQQAPGVRVRAVYGASDELADHLLAGAPGDIYLTADPQQLERLVAVGLIRPEQQATLAENGLAAVCAAKADLSVRRPRDLTSRSWRIAIAEPSCPLGRYTRAFLESLDLYSRLRSRAVWVENSRAAVTAARAGQADLALVYSSDAAHADACRTLFRVRRLPARIRYRGAVVHRGQPANAAEQLLAFLCTPRSVRVFCRCGFHAVRDRG